MAKKATAAVNTTAAQTTAAATRIPVKGMRSLLIKVQGFPVSFVEGLTTQAIIDRWEPIFEAFDCLVVAAEKAGFRYHEEEVGGFLYRWIERSKVAYFFGVIPEERDLPDDPVEKLIASRENETIRSIKKSLDCRKYARLQRDLMEGIALRGNGGVVKDDKGKEHFFIVVGKGENARKEWISERNLTVPEAFFPASCGLIHACASYGQTFWPQEATLKRLGYDYTPAGRFEMKVSDLLATMERDRDWSGALHTEESEAIKAFVNRKVSKRQTAEGEAALEESELQAGLRQASLVGLVLYWLKAAYAFELGGVVYDQADTDGERDNKRYVRVMPGSPEYQAFLTEATTNPMAAIRVALVSLLNKQYQKADESTGQWTPEVLAYQIRPFSQDGTLTPEEFIGICTALAGSEDAGQALAKKACFVCNGGKATKTKVKVADPVVGRGKLVKKTSAAK